MAFPDDIGNDLTFIILMFFLDFFFLGDIVINFITA
jgi:hyperpolarization activated cyclic nucleotide-gated potassium channel 2